MYVNDSSGNRSLTATLAYVGFIAVMIKVLLNGSSMEIPGGASYSFGTIDAATVAAVLGATLGSYTARRWNGQPEPPADVSTGAGSKPNDGAA